MASIVIGTRGSRLALWQAHYTRDALSAAHPGLTVELEIIRTSGDKNLTQPLHQMGGKGLFTKELEDALLDGRVDLAVHSLKDLPTELPPGLALGATPAREDPADALIAKDGLSLADLPAGATVLTGSLRREAQVRHARPDVEVGPVRGNVETRIRKLDESDAAAVVLARAGLVRLGLADRITQRLDPTEFLPACAQGALGIEIREGDQRTAGLLAAIDNPAAGLTARAERAMLAGLGGGCQTPVGAHGRAVDDEGTMELIGMVADLAGQRMIRRTVRGPVGGIEEAEKLGAVLANEILRGGGREILAEIEADTGG